MIDYLIITEKDSAKKNFEKAFGGERGALNGKTYHLVSLAGHVLEYDDPNKMVDDPDEQKKLGTWDLKNLPWDASRFNWSYHPVKNRNRIINNLKDAIRVDQPQALVIATDSDPSGEGDLLGWEVIDYVHWNGPVYRMNFADETIEGLKKGFDKLHLIADKMQDETYLYGLARQRFDYCSMQLTRAATMLLDEQEIGATLRIGRLKSVIISYVYQQIQEHKNYVKKPFFNIRWQDEHKNVYTLKDEDKFDNKADAETALQQNKPSKVKTIQHKDRFVEPPKMLSLSALAGKLAPKGFKTNEIKSVYQKMYEDHVVSYPRTVDTVVTAEQYQELVDLSDQIAACVGVDPKLLTHKTPRKRYLKKSVDHGANRPGDNVPESLNAVEHDYGKCGSAIYELLAKNTLATMMDDAKYDHIEMTLENDAKCTKNVLLEKHWKSIYQDGNDDDQESVDLPEIGENAEPFIREGVNPRTPLPTVSRLMKYLEKVNIGTGATRVSTEADLATRELTESKTGKLGLTALGEANALTIKDALISTPEATRKLEKTFDKMAKEHDISKIGQLAANFLKHDLPFFENNSQKFKQVASTDTQKALKKKKFERKTDENSFEVTYNGKKGRIKYVWGNERFTDKEVEKLKNGEEIIIRRKSSKVDKNGKPKEYRVKLKVGKKKFNGREIITLISEFTR